MCTPERAYDSFKKAVEVANSEVEFRCLSRKLKDEQGLSWFKYRAGRGQFMSAHKSEVRAFLSSELKRVLYHPDNPNLAKLELTSADQRGEFLLINEPEFRITTHAPASGEDPSAETRFEGDCPVPIEQLVHRDPSGAGLSLSFQPVAEGWPSSRPISEVIVRNQWRFYEILDISKTPFPSGDAKAAGDKPKP